MTSIYLSYHRADDKYLKKVEEIIDGFKTELGIEEIEFLKVQGYQGGTHASWWREVNEQIKKSVVIFLVTEGWFAHHQYELRITLHHKRDFIVLYCYPGIFAPSTFPDSLRQALDQHDAVNLFEDKAFTINEPEQEQLKMLLKRYLVDDVKEPSRKHDIAPKAWFLKFKEWIQNLEELRNLLTTITALAVLALTCGFYFVLFFTGSRLDVGKALSSIDLAVSTPHPLPENVKPLHESGTLVYYLGEGNILNISFLDLETEEELDLIPPSSADSSNPAWSCDGTKVAYTSNVEDDNYEIYVYDFTHPDSPPQRITHTADINEGYVDWSPDGQKLIFSAQYPDDRNLELYTLSIETGEIQKLTSNGVGDRVADWSCANGLIIFESGVGDEPGRNDIYVLDPNKVGSYPNGTGINLTIRTGGRTRFPAWSCDGTKIAYHASPDRNIDAELYVMNFDIDKMETSNIRQVTDNEYNDFGPAWSPDGKYLVFHANGRDNNYDLYAIDLVTEAITRLTKTPEVSERYADWRPTGECS